MSLQAISLERIIQKYKRVEVQSNEERQELAKTSDADLVHRVNGLFGVQNDSYSPP
jgi:hypothetical protein